MRMQEEERKVILTTREIGKYWQWMSWRCTTALSSWRTSSNWIEMPTAGTKGVNTSSSTLDLEMSWVETDSFKLVDTSTLSTQGIPVNAADTLHNFFYILNSVHWNFQDEYVPHEYVTVDEAMVPFKGHLGFTNSLSRTNPWNLGSSCRCWLMMWQPTVTTWRSTQVKIDSRSTD